jgi:hypothetical protein
MPIFYQVDPLRPLLHVVVSGVITDDDLRRYLADLYADAAVVCGLDVLCDFRLVEALRLTPEGVRCLAAKPLKYDTPVRHAFVACGELGYGLGRMYIMLCEDDPGEVMVFRELEQAREWLGVRESDEAEPTLSAAARS